MSCGGRAKSAPKLDLKLNLSPPRAANNNLPFHQAKEYSPKSSSPSSCGSSCLSLSPSEAAEYNNNHSFIGYSSKNNRTHEEVVTSMVVVGCPRCLMYVMLSEVDPKCPRCKSTVLLDFHGEDMHAKKNTN